MLLRSDEDSKLRARLNTAADEYADGKIDAEQLERITARVRPKLEESLGRARIIDDRPLIEDLVGGPDVASTWHALPLTRRRALPVTPAGLATRPRQRRAY